MFAAEAAGAPSHADVRGKAKWPLVATVGGAAFVLVVGTVAVTIAVMRHAEDAAVVASIEPSTAKTAEAPQTSIETAASASQGQDSASGQTPSPDLGIVTIPAKAASGQGAAATNGSPRYRWRAGDVIPYKIEVTAQVGQGAFKVLGDCLLEVSAWDADQPTQASAQGTAAPEVERFTGSAFVIHPDGYLATCAHVVEGASTVTLHLGGKRVEAQVVARNEPDDLALLKVAHRGLPYLSLANSDATKLGEDVRVLGYPLSDVLGSNLKVSRGIVAGEVIQGGSKRVQLDALVNPGNSGGPVVNERGEVVGVISSRFSGSGISPVPFAVPSNSLRQLLAGEQIAPPPPNAGPSIDGAALVAKASASMSLVEVEAAVPQPGEGRVVRLQASYRMEQPVADQQRRMPLVLSSGPSYFSQEMQLLVDEHGTNLGAEGNLDIPFTVGAMPLLMIERLDLRGGNTWVHETETVFRHAQTPAGFGPMGGMRPDAGRFAAPFSMPLPSPVPRMGTPPPSFGMPAEQRFTADQRYEYKIGGRQGSLVTIEKKYAMETDDLDADLSVAGRGTVTFDECRGCVVTVDYQQTISVAKDNVRLEIPVTIKIAEVPAGEYAAKRLARAAEAARRERSRQSAVDAAAGVTAEQRVDGLMRSITRQLEAGANTIPEVRALGEFDIVPSRQQKVAKLLLALAASEDHNWDALTALKKWADASCVPALVKFVESSDSRVATDAAEILGNLGDVRAAKPLAAALAREGFGGHQYEEALKSLGPAAESAVLPLLDDRSEDVRRSACDVLAEIGGEHSAAKLRQIIAETAGRSGFESHHAERALGEIRTRSAGRDALAAVGSEPLAHRPRSNRNLTLERAREIVADPAAGSQELQSALHSLSQTSPPDDATRREVALHILQRLPMRGDAFTQSAALEALAKWSGPENETEVLALLEKASDGDRGELVQALATAGGTASAEKLLPMLREHKADRRLGQTIAEALGATTARGNARAVEGQLYRLLDSSDVTLRTHAATALGYIPGAQSRKALDEFLKKESHTIAWLAAIDALGRQQAAE